MSRDWTLDAPCRDEHGFTPSEDDFASEADLRRLCGPLLATCGPCPFRAVCIATVKPAQARFDGIAGGRLWWGGLVIAALDDVFEDELTEPKLRASCGTEAGAQDHKRHGERVCPSCRQAEREMAARRKAQKAKQPKQLQLDFA
ncbi:hypothetical protein GCM10014715_39190 [Streptomyces spiralis]|uniref:4Fe-4S Wbl-type domain-containing protein n=1 Tax=Streptomyces spiralis TaxID=66376 RepID=A0A919A0K9_9ACTN|nr:hypothetical protein [Streptomyces spiralis]GHE80012.1 hypothetical protein GCM10014715_39190 [Streptomyces spiralis]